MSPHPCSACGLVLGVGETGERNLQRFPSLRGQKYLVLLVLFDKFLSCGFQLLLSSPSWAHQVSLNMFFCLLPVIQFFDTARVDRTRSWLYAACSVSYLGAMVSSNSALQFVNYPTQVKPQGGRRVGSAVVGKERRILLSGPWLK